MWLKHDRLYPTWQSMKQRCYNRNHKSYAQYGGRGIVVCDEWLHNFVAFRDWANSHGFKEGMSLDRINADREYSPDNCRYISLSENCSKQRTTIYVTINGVTKSLTGWAKAIGTNQSLLRYRVKKFGWTYEMAITIPRNRSETMKILKSASDAKGWNHANA